MIFTSITIYIYQKIILIVNRGDSITIIKWLGHASFLIKSLGKNIYIDPYEGEYSEKADLILVTHRHRDHCDLEKINSIRELKTRIYTCSDCAQNLQGNIVSISPGDIKDIHSMKIEAIESYNFKRFRSSGVPFHPKGTQIGFIISSEGKRVYHVGDSDFIPEMNRIDDVDVALLPTMGRATMDLEEAVEATIAIDPKIAIPMHRRGANAEDFKKKVETKSNVKVLAIAEGDEIDP